LQSKTVLVAWFSEKMNRSWGLTFLDQAPKPPGYRFVEYFDQITFCEAEQTLFASFSGKRRNFGFTSLDLDQNPSSNSQPLRVHLRTLSPGYSFRGT
jgi:hypothetical protein